MEAIMLILQMYSVVSARVEGAVSVDMTIITGYNLFENSILLI
jgi:hypothetical protein